MKKITLFICCFFAVAISNAQVPTFQWVKDIGGSSADEGASVAIDISGNVYTTGRFQGTVDFDPGAGTYTLTSNGIFDIFISKLSPGGNFLWAKQIGGTAIDIGWSIALDAFGNVYTTGFFSDTVDFNPGAATFTIASVNYQDIFISKLDAAGNFVWAKNMQGATGEGVGWSITADASGNVYTTGPFSDTLDFDPGVGTYTLPGGSGGYADIFISKLDASGNFVWAKNFGGITSDIGYSIKVDASKNVYTTGYFGGTVDFDPGAGIYNLTSAGSRDIFISKLDAAGNFVWAKSLGDISSSDEGKSIWIDTLSNIYVTGSFEGSVDFDPGVGTYSLTTGSGTFDAFVLKLDAAGNFVWAKNIGGVGYADGFSITTDKWGGVYVAGDFGFGLVDFDPGAAVFNLNSAGNSDIFILKLDASGNFVWAGQMGDSQSDRAYSIAIDAASNIYTTGWFAGNNVDFDPSVGAFYVNSFNGTDDIFIHKMSQPTIGIKENTKINNVSIFPNPTNDKINLVLEKEKATLKLTNSLGQKVFEKENVTEQKLTIDISEQANGIYFLEVKQGETISRMKIIKN